MSKKLVCYFSATGNTKGVAEKVSSAFGADIFEIAPLKTYTTEDLDYDVSSSRVSLEMKNLQARPEIKQYIETFDSYKTIYLGFPIWWYTCPRIINTFIEHHDFTDKEVFIFVTSGSSSYDTALNDLKTAYPNINFIGGVRLKNNVSVEEIKSLMK